MSIRFACLNCRATLNAPEGTSGQKVRCPRCQQRVTVPSPPAAPVRPDQPERQSVEDVAASILSGGDGPPLPVKAPSPAAIERHRYPARPKEALDDVRPSSLGLPPRKSASPWMLVTILVLAVLALAGTGYLGYQFISKAGVPGEQKASAAPPTVEELVKQYQALMGEWNAHQREADRIQHSISEWERILLKNYVGFGLDRQGREETEQRRIAFERERLGPPRRDLIAVRQKQIDLSIKAVAFCKVHPEMPKAFQWQEAHLDLINSYQLETATIKGRLERNDTGRIAID